MVVVDLVSQPHFFVGVVIGLAIEGAVLTRGEVAVGFLGLFL